MILFKQISRVALIMVFGCAGTSRIQAQPQPPAHFTVTPYDSHIEIHWDKTTDPDVTTYHLYRRNEAGNFELLKVLTASDTFCLDFVGAQNVTHTYTVTSRSSIGVESDTAASVTATTFEMTDDQFLDMVQKYTFRYFWNFGHPVSGLARERNTSGETVTMGGSGFGVMAILVGIKRGFITWDEGLSRILKIVLFLESADRFYGVFPHWMNGTTGKVIPFSTQDNGGDIVETAFLFEGLLTAREYFDGNSTNEVVLRQKITNMWQEINWDWYRDGRNVLLWHWSPNYGFALNHEIRGWNEALIIYLLAIASPTHAVPPSIYYSGWAGNNYTNGFSIYGYQLFVGPVTGGPLFFAHYSFIGFDPRYYKDPFANYFIQNRNHTLINRAYCIDNPGGYDGYSDVCWGLTASDDPLVGYLAHEATPNRDNGTIAPTAALSSMPYTPQESIAALKHFYRAYGAQLWGPEGFYDAFNLSQNWFADTYIAIDEGPIICMIENYRSQLLWNHFMANPEITDALDAIGFEPDSTSVGIAEQTLPGNAVSVYPNPADSWFTVKNNWKNAVVVEGIGMQGIVLFSSDPIASGATLQLRPPSQAGVLVLKITDTQGMISIQKMTVLPDR